MSPAPGPPKDLGKPDTHSGALLRLWLRRDEAQELVCLLGDKIAEDPNQHRLARLYGALVKGGVHDPKAPRRRGGYGD